MSTSAELKIGEAFKDKVFLIETATGNPHLLQNPTCVIIDESGNRAAGVPAEESDGWYTCSFTPDAAGTWSTEWANAGSTIYHAFKEFKVGSATIASTYDRIGAPAGATIAADLVVIDNFVDDLETRLTAARAGYLDELAAANIPADVDTLKAAVVVIDEYHDVPAQNAAANAQMNEVIGNKTDTVAGDSLVSLAKLIKAKTDNLPADPADDSDLDTAIAAVNTDLGNYSGQANLTSLLAALGIPDVAGKPLYTCLVTDRLDNATYGLSALETLVDGIEARTNNNLQTVTFFSPCQAEVVADTSHTDAAMPTVTIPNWTGTIVHVYAGFKFRMIENTNAAANKLSGAQEIQVNKAGGAWTDAINLVDDQFGLAATTREGGDCVIGYTDLVGTIDVFNTTAQFQWDEPLTDQDALHFNDVQTFVIIQYY